MDTDAPLLTLMGFGQGGRRRSVRGRRCIGSSIMRGPDSLRARRGRRRACDGGGGGGGVGKAGTSRIEVRLHGRELRSKVQFG